MRIMMITDDTIIDRRILLEAESLIKQGNEVILLAAWSEGLPLHETIGNVKIERVMPDFQSKLSKFILRFNSISIRGINALSRGLNKFFEMAHKAFGRFLIIFSYLLSGLYFLLNNIFIKAPALLINKCCNRAYQLFSRFAFKKLRNTYMVKRAIYYQPDVIHVHDLPQLPAGCQIKKKLKIPLIYDAHELYPEIDTLTQKQKKQLYKTELKLSKHCDTVITVNEFIADLMDTRYQINKTNVIYNAISNFSISDSNKTDLFRKTLNISADDKILLFQGWMSKTRGLQKLVESMKWVDTDIHLVLMGYGEVQDELREIISQNHLGQRVHILDAVPQNELLYWTASADAGIIPYQPIDLNNFYCSPNKLFEFIQAHLPIIANDLPFLKKVVDGNGFGLTAELNSAENYAKAINQMFNEKQRYQNFKKNLLDKSPDFSWAVEEKKLYGLYEKYNKNTSLIAEVL